MELYVILFYIFQVSVNVLSYFYNIKKKEEKRFPNEQKHHFKTLTCYKLTRTYEA